MSNQPTLEEARLAQILHQLQRAEESCELGFFSTAKAFIQQARANVQLLQAQAKLARLTIKHH